MTMKCNMCLEGDMIHEFVITNKNTKDITVLSPETISYKSMARYVETGDSQRAANGDHITHIYNCAACPNSQLEYHEPLDAIAYEKAMNQKN